MWPGFLPFSRASFVLDFVGLSLFLVLPALTYSLYLIKNRVYQRHKMVQIILASVVGAAVLLFEVEVRIFGWRQYAESSPYYEGALFPFLYFHIFVATLTTIGWALMMFLTLRQFPGKLGEGPYHLSYRELAWGSAIGMYLTAISGWVFYYMAFIA